MSEVLRDLVVSLSLDGDNFSRNTGWNLNVSDDLFDHSGSASNIRLSFDLKRTDVDTSAASVANVYTGIWVYYRYVDANGNTVITGRGWYLRSTDASFVATDEDWVRMRYGPLNLSSFNPTGIAYVSIGTGGANGTTGTVQFRNLKVEVLDSWTDWSAAPEDLYGMSTRMANAETRITQNANNIALKVSTVTYNAEKVYRSSTAPTTLYTNMLWLDTSSTPDLLKRYTGSEWVAAGAEEVKSSGMCKAARDRVPGPWCPMPDISSAAARCLPAPGARATTVRFSIRA